ncbi:oligopeptide ABC transporter permease protein [Mycoplasmopsis californica HAZ160_1]|uniref:Oligopeptide ABC transporter permease protein n=1 Tax=Mycoplasmopsis californica HAZ160_1 TaxID=1397850 RepID=A0AAT9F832_9BACT|nr:ABC transporter permease [Mycoplasmopsis californica]BAP01052.1 oligopeptide ABC transporter permease protein [Mycoplasmopsis californica HAZ160_1]BBG40917.1 oligopeptide ABC transporter permease protein [Mycoplasmopsis californica]BBG41511.1 oligopeptide ABC transporter permease protein [Mycoplasmopsis californica]BBG42104.1 oligopeptide ABC transporter permease protein [Mycoplasmopsis californica]BBG42687.1 oligopeptide ABC transporter permease protein [Mycoplasmopsis californica]
MSNIDQNFNKKYGISAELALKLVRSQEVSNNNIAGKPKILAIEILRRFFTNPAVLIAFSVFLVIILIATIVTYTSPYPATERIDAYWPADQKVSNVGSLPPMFNPWKETTDESVIKSINFWATSTKYKEYLKPYLTHTFINSSLVRYNPYTYFEGSQLLARLIKWEKENPTRLITPDVIAQIKSQIPVLKTFLGTNELGADVWTTVWKGTLESLWIALFVSTVEIIIGVFVGAYLGFNAGKALDTFMMRLIEIFTSPPSIIWLLLFVSIWGTNPWVLIAGLLFVGWTGPIGVTRLFIITVKDEEYIIAAKSIGATETRQIFMHALPAILGKIAMSFVRRIPSVILSIASLAFLGFFSDSKSANLGKFMLDNINDSKTNPWLLMLPASILLGISISLQFIAVGLHDALDPKVIKIKR